MQRRRSAPHTFEGNIAAEKAKLEAQLADLKPGPQMDALRKKIRQLETASHMNEARSICASSPCRKRSIVTMQGLSTLGDEQVAYLRDRLSPDALIRP